MDVCITLIRAQFLIGIVPRYDLTRYIPIFEVCDFDLNNELISRCSITASNITKHHQTNLTRIPLYVRSILDHFHFNYYGPGADACDSSISR